MFSYEELLSKYNILLKENKELKSQVTELKTKLGMPIETEEVVVETSDTVINKYSSTTEKILLYRSLFCGREDVFARRWYSKITEKSGYQPVCENEWADGLCDKRKYKCSVCPNRKLSPLTDKDIYKHLEGKDYYGKDVIGIYPMLVDECHHVSAVNFEKILKYANAKYVYGLTATPTRQDGHHPIIFMQCGPIRYRVDAKAQAEKREFEHYLIPRFTSFRNIADDNITALYKKLSDDAMRNNLIVNDVVATIKNGRTPIILSERREHVTMLTELLKPHCDNVIEIVGTTSAKSRRETLERLDNIPQEESLVVVATGRYVGEGFDYPRLDTLFLALPIAWKGKVAQYAGRLHRNYQGKTEVQVYDYIDIHVPVLERMYQKRVKSYSAIGYKAKITTSSNASPDLIYDGKTFYPVFCRDIEITQNEILIVSPFMRKARLTQMLKVLSPLIMNKVTVIFAFLFENFEKHDVLLI